MPDHLLSLATLRNRLHVRGWLEATTALRIGTGRSHEVGRNDLPVLRDSFGAPLIPGASLKGAFRARMEALVSTLQPTQVRDFQQLEDHMRNTVAALTEDKAILNASTLIDLTFGAPWVAGRVFFRDALVDRSLWFDQYETRNGVAINRDTETVDGGKLYDYEVVPAGVRFGFELVMEQAAEWQLGMLLLGLRPWQRGEVQIGGFRSRGLGHIQLMDVQATYAEYNSIDAVLGMLGHGESPERTLALDGSDASVHRWAQAFKEALTDPEATITQGATNA